jgi:hypothetical protein
VALRSWRFYWWRRPRLRIPLSDWQNRGRIAPGAAIEAWRIARTTADKASWRSGVVKVAGNVAVMGAVIGASVGSELSLSPLIYKAGTGTRKK